MTAIMATTMTMEIIATTTGIWGAGGEEGESGSAIMQSRKK